MLCLKWHACACPSYPRMGKLSCLMPLLNRCLSLLCTTVRQTLAMWPSLSQLWHFTGLAGCPVPPGPRVVLGCERWIASDSIMHRRSSTSVRVKVFTWHKFATGIWGALMPTSVVSLPLTIMPWSPKESIPGGTSRTRSPTRRESAVYFSIASLATTVRTE
jgi:hypothetical protein